MRKPSNSEFPFVRRTTWGILLTGLAVLALWLAAPMRHARAAPPAAASDTAAPAALHGEGGNDDCEPGDDCGGDDGADDGGGDDCEPDDDCGVGAEVEWDGFIVTLPTDLGGAWVVQFEVGAAITVTTVPTTTFRPANLAAFRSGDWVEVDGTLQADGSVLATRIRRDDFEAGEVVLRLAPGVDPLDIADDYGLTYLQRWSEPGHIYLFGATEDSEESSADELVGAGDDRIVWAEPNFAQGVPENDGYKTWAWGGPTAPDEYAGQSAYLQIGLGYEARQYRGEDVVVAVLDTGVYTPHEQFVGRLQLPALDVIQDDADPSEVGPGLAWGHGTHVAGVIAAMAPEATILPVRVLDQNGRGNTFLLAYAIEWAAQQPGVKIINLSLGTDANSQILQEVIARVVDQGIIVVAAAGNRGDGTLQYPAAYPGVIGVTAVDGDYHKPSFANFGAPLVDLAAPGVGIMSTMIHAAGPGYATWSGTSMSAAFVSGAAALVADQEDVQTMAASTVVERLLEGGVDLDAANPEYAGQLGVGLNVSRALGVVGPVASRVNLPAMQR